MGHSQPHPNPWRFGLFERFVLAVVIMVLGVLQLVQLAYLLEQAGATAAQIDHVTQMMAVGLIVSMTLLMGGGPVLRSAVAKAAPLVRAALGA